MIARMAHVFITAELISRLMGYIQTVVRLALLSVALPLRSSAKDYKRNAKPVAKMQFYRNILVVYITLVPALICFLLA